MNSTCDRTHIDNWSMQAFFGTYMFSSREMGYIGDKYLQAQSLANLVWSTDIYA